MEQHEQDGTHYVRKVVLPSGKTIDVVLFNEAPAEGPETGPSLVPEPEQDLHVCLHCESELVYPTQWEEAGPSSWQVELRCPECETHRAGVFSQDCVDAFDEVLDRGTDELTADLRRLMRANMAEEVERFSAALAVDAILPEDF